MENDNIGHDRSGLFLLRLWLDEREEPTDRDAALPSAVDGRRRGRLLHVVSGEGRTFDSWSGLVDLLEGLLSSSQPTPDDTKRVPEKSKLKG